MTNCRHCGADIPDQFDTCLSTGYGDDCTQEPHNFPENGYRDSMTNPANEWREEVIKVSVNRFDSRFRPVTVGYDGSESDEQKRMDYRAFMATEIELALATHSAHLVERAEERGYQRAIMDRELDLPFTRTRKFKDAVDKIGTKKDQAIDIVKDNK